MPVAEKPAAAPGRPEHRTLNGSLNERIWGRLGSRSGWSWESPFGDCVLGPGMGWEISMRQQGIATDRVRGTVWEGVWFPHTRSGKVSRRERKGKAREEKGIRE